jgi:hypothetical protein
MSSAEKGLYPARSRRRFQNFIRSRVALISAAGPVAIIPASAWATTYTWNGGSGDWNSDANWTPSGVPSVDGDVAEITHSSGGSYTVTYDYSGTAALLSLLIVDYTTSFPTTVAATLSLSANLLEASNENIGYDGRGVLSQSGGVNSVHTKLVIGVNIKSTGTYTLTAGSLGAGNEYIGDAGIGSFNQSGGTNVAGAGEFLTPDEAVYIGFSPGSTGTHTLSGSGTLVAEHEDIGAGEFGSAPGGVGIFDQSGGTNEMSGVATGLFVGTGAYILSGTGTLSSQSEIVGPGVFNQSGGVNTVDNLSIGSTGNYTLSGGVLMQVGEFNDVSLTETGTLTVNNTGQLAIDGDLHATGDSQVHINGGTVIAGGLWVNGGTYTQTGGTAVFGHFLGTSGAVTVNGGSMTLVLGDSFPELGSLNISGAGILGLQLGGYATGEGYEDISLTGPSSLGGTLDVDMVNGFQPVVGDQFTVMTDAVPFTGAFDNLTSDDGLVYTVNYGASNIVEITITAVPEPGCAAIFALSSIVLYRRRRRSSS